MHYLCHCIEICDVLYMYCCISHCLQHCTRQENFHERHSVVKQLGQGRGKWDSIV